MSYIKRRLKSRPSYRSASGSVAEDLFIDLFSDAFGAEKTGHLYSQYYFYDIYQNSRYADFVIENAPRRIAIEIDDEASHNKHHMETKADLLLYVHVGVLSIQFVRINSIEKNRDIAFVSFCF